jgi:hypothetical protein
MIKERVTLSEKIAGALIICYVFLGIINTLITKAYFIFQKGFKLSLGGLFSDNFWNSTITLLNLILYLILAYFSIVMLRGDKRARRKIIKISLFGILVFFPLIVLLFFIIIGPHSLMMFVPLTFTYLFLLVILLLLRFK